MKHDWFWIVTFTLQVIVCLLLVLLIPNEYLAYETA